MGGATGAVLICRIETMAITATRPHPIFLAGKWVESPDVLEVVNPARPDEPAGATYNATPEQYEEAVLAAIARRLLLRVGLVTSLPDNGRCRSRTDAPSRT